MAQTTTVVVDNQQVTLATTPQTLGTVQLGQQVMLISPVIDAFAAANTTTVIVPAMGAGIRFVAAGIFKGLVITRSGTLTAPPQGKAGNNGAHDNTTPNLACPASGAQVTLASPGDNIPFTIGSLTGMTNVFGSPELTTDVLYDLATPATGAGATLTFRLVLTGYFAMFP
jgi:hypothetical protein